MKSRVLIVSTAALLAACPLACGQTIWDGSEVDDFWQNPLNWVGGVVPNGATDDAQVGAPSPTVTNGAVLLRSLNVTADGVVNVGISQSLDFAGGAAVSLTNAGSVTALNNSDLQARDTISNSGDITIASTANQTDLELALGGATLTGGGTVTLSGPLAGINDVSGTQTLTIADQTIQGVGNVGRNSADFDNQANGLFDANVNAAILVLDAVDGFANAGTLRASGGGILELRDAGAGDFANAGGTIEALAGSEVRLVDGARIVGGVLSTTGAGLITATASANVELDNLTLNGNYVAGNNSDTRIVGTLTNTGSITLASTANPTDLEIADGGATLTGGGTVTLTGPAAGINDQSGTQLLVIENQTIQGVGNLGQNTANFDNQGNLIHANVGGGTLRIDAVDFFTNTGTLRASNGGTLELRDAGAGDIANVGGLIEALDGSEVLLNTGARIVGGTLSTAGSGQFRTAVSQNTTLENLTLSGTYLAENNSDTRIVGTLTNTGSITLASTANPTDLEIAVGGATLTGGGTVTLTGPAAGINDESGVQLLTIENQTIQGAGNLGRNTANFDNQGNLIHANVGGGTLTIDAVDFFTNTGTLRASNGGTLELRDAGVGDIANAGGLIEALDGSEVLLKTTARIVGGTLSTAGSGQFRTAASENTTLENLTLSGTYLAENNSDTRIVGTLTNTGSITIASTANQTDLEIAVGGATLTGGGTVTLTGAVAGINDESGVQLLTIENQTILGEGNLGRNTANFDNQGNLIHANVGGGTLIVDAFDLFTNTGTLRASNGATLELLDAGAGDIANAGGLIEALAGSEVRLISGARVVGGTLSTTGSGVFTAPGSANVELEDLTLNGDYVAGNNSDTRITGTINNTGSITIAATANQTDLEVADGGATLTGGGTVVLSGVNAGVNDALGLQTLTIGDQTVRGRGNIGRNTTNLVNTAAGTILADDAAGLLLIDVEGAGTWTNDGTLAVSNDATLGIIGDLIGTSTAVLSGHGTIVADGGDISHDGLISPGASPGQLNLNANVTLGITASVFIELGGTTPVTGYDVLNVANALTLGGDLDVFVSPMLVPTLADTFEVVTTDTLSGAFANAAHGDVLASTDGGYTFTVNYGAGSAFTQSSVVLSNFELVPEPTTLVVAGLGGLALLGRRRRRA